MVTGDTRAIEIHALRVQYGDYVAVDGLDLTADSGEVVALLGPNGAGKTSTVEAAEGYRRRSGGEVRILGLDPVADRRSVSQLVGVMLQSGGVYPGMSPRQVLSLFAHYYAAPEAPDQLLELVGLTRVAGAPWRRLSGGEHQRLSLALALVGRPRVAILDEPTSGVDPEGRQVMRQAIADLRDRGSCVLLTTHELAEAERMADRLVVIDGGHLVAAGTLDELAALTGPAAVRWTTSPGAATGDLARRLGAPIREEQPGQYVAETAGDPATVAAIAGWLSEQGLPLGGLRAGLPALEDIYLRLTGGSPASGGPASGGSDPGPSRPAGAGGRDQGTSSPATGGPRGRADG